MLTGQRISLRSPYFTKAKPKKRGKRKKGSGGGHLALQWLGFVDLISMQLAYVAAQSALLCPSFEIARQTLRHHGIELGVKTIQRICQLIGRQAMDNRQCIAMSDLDRADDRMVLVCIDGGRIRERKKKRGRRPAGQKRQGYHTDWREPTQIVIQCFNADGSKCKDFLPLYDPTTGKIDQVFELVESYLRQMQISTAEHVVFCADGDRRYWKRFGPLAKKLQITDHFEVIDYTHAKQNLLKIIEKLPKKMDPCQKTKSSKNGTTCYGRAICTRSIGASRVIVTLGKAASSLSISLKFDEQNLNLPLLQLQISQLIFQKKQEQSCSEGPRMS